MPNPIRLNFNKLPPEVVKEIAENTLRAGGYYDANEDASEIKKLREGLESAVLVLQSLAERIQRFEEGK